jgi:hypothetical protein
MVLEMNSAQFSMVGKLLGVTAVLVCASLTLAQGGGGRGQGRGGARGTQMGEAQLLMRKDVQKDLGLSEDQVTKLTDWSEKQRANRGQGGNGGGNGGGNRGNGGNGGGGNRGNGGGQLTDEQRAEMAKRAAERREATRKELLTIISEAQLKRVDEIALQLQGNMAVMQAEVQKALALKEDQIEKIKDLQKRQQEANRTLFEKIQSQEITREDMQASMQKNNEIMKTEIGKILTSDQSAKLKAMQGKPFVADPA